MRLFALVLALLSAAPAAAQDSTVVYLVRHAEKAADAGDPPLSAAGEARALALAERLADAGVGAVVVTQYRRTGATAAPTAAAAGVEPRVVAAAPGPVPHPRAVADAVREAGGTVLVVGHSNTVTAIVRALGGPPLPALCDAEYANLFVLVLRPGAEPRLERGTYGAPDPDGAAECADS